MKKLLILFFCITSLLPAAAQQPDVVSAEYLTERFGQQLSRFPQEKIHMHTDKAAYILGEKIWFRLFMVNALSHFPESASRYIYTELVNPFDEVVMRVKIRPDSTGIFHGYIALEDSLPGGTYTLRAYTGFMRNLDEDYFFRKSVEVISPFAKDVHPEVSFDYTPDSRKVTAYIRFRDVKTGAGMRPGNVEVSTEKGPQVVGWEGKDSTFRVKLALRDYAHRVMQVGFGNYKQYIPLAVTGDTYDVSFFPEGGHLLAGTSCRVAFKALRPDGLGETLEGMIVTEAGDTVTKILTQHKGMGFFDIKPEPGKKYYAVCMNADGVPGRFELPAATGGAYSLKVTNLNDKMYVSVQHAADVQSKDSLFLVMHLRGIVEYAEWWDPGVENMLFQKKDFPSGVSHLMLLDKHGNILSERLFFSLGKDQAEAAFRADRPEYNPRERVRAEVRVTDPDGQPLSGNFSVAVTDDADVEPDTTRSILSTLLLSSELRGYIEDPEYYIRNDNAASRMALDILLMTQGWRRYPVPEMIGGKFAKPRYPLEVGQCISGYVKSIFRGKKLASSALNLLSPDQSFITSTQTDSTGHFMFCGFEFPDSTRYLIHAFSEKGRKNVELVLDTDTFPEVKMPVPLYGRFLEKALPLEYIEKSDQRLTAETGIRNVLLDEVVIVGHRRPKTEYESVSSKTISSKQLQQYGSTSLKTVLMGIPGVFVMGDKITYRGDGTLVFLVDGSLMDDPLMIESVLDVMPLDDVEQIDLIKDGATMVYAPGGADAIIAITTKTGFVQGPPQSRYNVGLIKPLGYQKPEAFYAPTYETEQQKTDITPDLRTTIHWQPDVQVPPDGSASFDFYTADARTSYSVVIEGLTPEGKLFRAKGRVEVK